MRLIPALLNLFAHLKDIMPESYLRDSDRIALGQDLGICDTFNLPK